MKVAKDYRPLIREILEAGYEVVQGKKHVKVIRPGRGMVYSLPLTPSDHRTLKNCRAGLRRLGVIR